MAQIDAIIQMNRRIPSLNKLNAWCSSSCKLKDTAHSMLPLRTHTASFKLSSRLLLLVISLINIQYSDLISKMFLFRFLVSRCQCLDNFVFPIHEA